MSTWSTHAPHPIPSTSTLEFLLWLHHIFYCPLVIPFQLHWTFGSYTKIPFLCHVLSLFAAWISCLHLALRKVHSLTYIRYLIKFLLFRSLSILTNLKLKPGASYGSSLVVESIFNHVQRSGFNPQHYRKKLTFPDPCLCFWIVLFLCLASHLNTLWLNFLSYKKEDSKMYVVLDGVMHAFNPFNASTEKTEAGGLPEIQGQPALYNKFKPCHNYRVKPWLQNKTK